MNKYERFDGIDRAFRMGLKLECSLAPWDSLPRVQLYEVNPDSYSRGEMNADVHGENVDLQLQRASREYALRLDHTGNFLAPTGPLDRFLGDAGELEGKYENGEVILEASVMLSDEPLISSRGKKFVTAYSRLINQMDEDFFKKVEDQIFSDLES